MQEPINYFPKAGFAFPGSQNGFILDYFDWHSGIFTIIMLRIQICRRNEFQTGFLSHSIPAYPDDFFHTGPIFKPGMD